MRPLVVLLAVLATAPALTAQGRFVRQGKGVSLGVAHTAFEAGQAGAVSQSSVEGSYEVVAARTQSTLGVFYATPSAGVEASGAGSCCSSTAKTGGRR